MSKSISVVNPSGDFEENIERLAKHLGKSRFRRDIFNVVYGRGTRPKSKKRILEAAGLKPTKAQQVQNELEHLSNHHLIVKIKNDGYSDDGSRFVYDKDQFVAANRELIVRLADNPGIAEQTPTKRRPVPVGARRVLVVKRRELRKRKKLKVLYLTASPAQADGNLRVDVEAELVRQAVRGSIYRDNIEIIFRPAANLDSIIEGLNDFRPQIVHFSGHGDGTGIAGDNRSLSAPDYALMPYKLIVQALEAADEPPQVLVLNSCESTAIRRELMTSVSVLISMKASISDTAAAGFAQKFYAAIAGGQSVKSAFKQGLLAVQMVSIGEKDTPELSSRGVDPAKVILT